MTLVHAMTRVITWVTYAEAAANRIDLRLVAPKACWPRAALVAGVQRHGEKNGAAPSILTEDIASGVKGADLSIPMFGSLRANLKRNGRSGCPSR